MNDSNNTPGSFIFLVLLILFQGLSGLAGGALLVIDPTGSLLNLPLEILKDSPFSSFLIPGIILLTVLGIFPIVAGWGLIKNKPWSFMGALLTGMMLLAWIIVEVLIIGYQDEPPLQALYGSVGALILLTLSAPSIRKYLHS